MTPEGRAKFRKRQKLYSQLFACLCWLSTGLCILILFGLLGNIAWKGMGHISWTFLTSLNSADPAKAGIMAALISSVWLITLTAIIAVPIGVGTAVYLEEYVRPSRWRSLIQLNIANLAGVPSIVYGILGLGLFVRFFALKESIIAGALTLSLVVLPIVILAAQEALRGVPNTIRQASYALGATRWQTVRQQVLPAATPGIMTGVILALSRALGEAAPLIAVGAVLSMNFNPISPMDRFSSLPIQIFEWSSLPQKEFQNLAAAGIIVLLSLLISMNAVAVYVRYRSSKRIRW